MAWGALPRQFERLYENRETREDANWKPQEDDAGVLWRSRGYPTGTLGMNRRLTRALSVMRWPSAVLGTLALGSTLLSSFTHTALVVMSPSRAVFIRTVVSSGGLEPAICVSREYPSDPETALLSLRLYLLPEGPRFSGWWEWGYRLELGQGFQAEMISIPLWCIFVPIGAFSALGFRAKRRLARPAGSCPNCGYPMASAAACPECGVAP